MSDYELFDDTLELAEIVFDDVDINDKDFTKICSFSGEYQAFTDLGSNLSAVDIDAGRHHACAAMASGEVSPVRSLVMMDWIIVLLRVEISNG